MLKKLSSLAETLADPGDYRSDEVLHAVQVVAHGPQLHAGDVLALHFVAGAHGAAVPNDRNGFN